MFLIVGLGNPGIEYEQTRHNIGFIAAETLANQCNMTWNDKSKYSALVASGDSEFGKIILCKPQTFMNLSGKSVQAMANFYKITPEQIIVLHDDLDIEVNKVKYKLGGSAGGHNGLKSIDSHIGPNYHRIRIGIGRPKDSRHDSSDFVLGKFSTDEQITMQLKIDKVADNLKLLLNKETELFKKTISEIK